MSEQNVLDAIAAVADQVTALAATVAALNPTSVVIQNPVAESGLVTLEQGSSYLAADGRALEWTRTGWPTLAGKTLLFRVFLDEATDFTPTSSVDGDEQTISVDLTAAATTALVAKAGEYELWADDMKLAKGQIVVNASIEEPGS